MTLFPMRFCRITAPFNYYTVNGVRSMHYALDLASYAKDPTVTAVHAGKVLSSFYDSAGGNMIVLRGDFAGEMDILTRYAHLASRSVKQGDVVAAGQTIGMQGNTGSQTTGQHLHFEVWILPKKVAYSFSQRSQYAVDPLSICHLTSEQIFEHNGKTTFAAIPQPEPKADLKALGDAKYKTVGKVEMFIYPDNRFSPIVGGVGRSKRYLNDFMEEREFKAAYSYTGGGVEWAGILTSWGLLWAPVVEGKSELTISSEEVVLNSGEENPKTENTDPTGESGGSDSAGKPEEETDSGQLKESQEDDAVDISSGERQRSSIWTAILRIQTAVFDAIRKMIRGERHVD